MLENIDEGKKAKGDNIALRSKETPLTATKWLWLKRTLYVSGQKRRLGRESNHSYK